MLTSWLETVVCGVWCSVCIYIYIYLYLYIENVKCYSYTCTFKWYILVMKSMPCLPKKWCVFLHDMFLFWNVSKEMLQSECPLLHHGSVSRRWRVKWLFGWVTYPKTIHTLLLLHHLLFIIRIIHISVIRVWFALTELSR